MKFLHFGDLHLWQARMEWGDALYPKRWLGFANLMLKRRARFPVDTADRVLERILASDADVVVFSGDFTTTSLRGEFDEAARRFAPLHEKWGERLFVIPGNHDRYTPKVLREQRYEKAFPYGAFDAPDQLVRSLDLPDAGFRIIGFDASEPFRFRSNGIMRPPLLKCLDAALERAADAGREVLLVGHFPYACPPEHPESWEHRLLGEEELAQLVAQYEPAVYLHGHKHVRWLLRPEITPETPCINCGSAGMKSDHPDQQAGFVEFELEPDGHLGAISAQTLQADGSFASKSM